MHLNLEGVRPEDKGVLCIYISVNIDIVMV